MDPRDQTFMTIHNLSPDANILFASDSVFDILGYQPDEVQGKSCFDYFHPDEVPFARSIHSRGVLLDKAAVLHYARILSRDGRWVSCECCFTVVHDVMVASISIYSRGEKSERRAFEAPQIRRIFSSSPHDPRYHMLEHLSPKFKMPPMEREPRAALILNRFTRNHSVMFATNAVSTILGLQPDEIKNKSFYECIQENCLEDAIQCLESAKANESIAYLRFWFRDPRLDEDDGDQQDVESANSDDGTEDEVNEDEDGNFEAHSSMEVDDDEVQREIIGDVDAMEEDVSTEASAPSRGFTSLPQPVRSPAFPYQSAAQPCQSPRVVQLPAIESRAASRESSRRRSRTRDRGPPAPFELEAVVSCTSDGLVVVLRKARPPVPSPHPPRVPALRFENGLFAAPWGQEPIRPYFPPDLLYTFRPPLLPQHMPLRDSVKAAGGPPLDQLMRSIRDVAVFAWALVGINGNIASYGRGDPRGGSQPAEGLPIWDPNTKCAGHLRPDGQRYRRWSHPNDTDDQTHIGPYDALEPLNLAANPSLCAYHQAAAPHQDSHGQSMTMACPHSLAPSRVGAYEQAHLQHQHQALGPLPGTPGQPGFFHSGNHDYCCQPTGCEAQQQQRIPLTTGRDTALHNLPRASWAEALSPQPYDLHEPASSVHGLSQRFGHHDFRY